MSPADPGDDRFRDPDTRPPIEPAPRRASGSKSSTSATIALVLGLVGLCMPILGVVAVIVGVVALGEIRRSDGEVSGEGLAWTGIVLGVLETLGMIAFVVMIVLGVAVGWKEGGGAVRGATASALLEQIAMGQQTMQAVGHLDADGDGVGEYGDLDAVAAFADLEANELNDPTVEMLLGYRLQLVLPESTDEREVSWWAFQEPTTGDGELPWLYIDESSVLRMSMDVIGTPSREDALLWEATNSDAVVEALAGDLFSEN